MAQTKYPVVVMRASDNCFLDIIRALAKDGISVIPVVFTWNGAAPWLSEQSCFFRSPVTIANPAEDEAASACQLEELGKKLYGEYGRKILLIASSDTALGLINRHFDRLGRYFLLMGGKNFDSDCSDIFQKDIFYARMAANGVPIPLTLPVLCHDDIDAAVAGMVYPCVYKPTVKDSGNSFQRTHNGRKAVECADPDQLREALTKEMDAGFTLVVQEKIEFDTNEDEVSCYVYADADGSIRMVSAQYKLYEYPAKFGTGVVSRTWFSDELADIAIKTIKAMNWHGFTGVELMRNRKTGKWLVIEANLRPWLSNYFQAAAGYNYLTMLYHDVEGELPVFSGIQKPQPENEMLYRINLTAFINKLVMEGAQPAEAFDKAAELITQHFGSTVFSYYVPQDPVPGLSEIADLRDRYRGCDEQIDRILTLMTGSAR